MAEPAREVDREATEELARALLICIRGHYRSRPPNRDAVLEALNALAFASAQVIGGTGPGEAEARQFFDDALDQNIAAAMEELGGRA